MDALDHAVSDLEELAKGATPREGTVHLDIKEDIAELVIDNPSARGALTVPMMSQLARSVRELRRWGGPAVILHGSDPNALCAGGHLDDVRSVLLSAAAGRRMAVAMGNTLNALRDLPMISVAVVSGAALGGGAELVTATDFRVWDVHAKLRFAQVELGVSTGWGGAGRLVDILGRREAARLLALGPTVGAEEALRIGLADRVAPEDAFGTAHSWLSPLLHRPVGAVRAMKAAIVAGRSVEAQADAFATVWAGPAHRRALGVKPS